MLLCYNFFDYIWGFIVQSMQLKFYSSVFKCLDDVCKVIFDIVLSAVWYWFGKYGIAVKIK